jgi:hypothetical protein
MGKLVVNDDLALRTALIERIWKENSSQGFQSIARDATGTSPFGMAIAFLLESWVRDATAKREGLIVPKERLADDLSAALVGAFPTIFLGTNDWATKPYQPSDIINDKVIAFSNHLTRIFEIFEGKPIVLTIVPEKDYVIDSHFLHTGRFKAIDSAIMGLRSLCQSRGVTFIYNDDVVPLRNFESEADFTYFDSHLTWRHYHQIFARAMASLGADWSTLSEHYTTVRRQRVGDLQSKFVPGDTSPTWDRVMTRTDVSLDFAEGHATFATPLGDTHQVVHNHHPLQAGKLLILGDSHSSILSMNNLTYLFSTAFEYCEFYWNPAGVRRVPNTTDADAVFLEISQRFIV